LIRPNVYLVDGWRFSAGITEFRRGTHHAQNRGKADGASGRAAQGIFN
jgi:hypothetical protein